MSALKYSSFSRQEKKIIPSFHAHSRLFHLYLLLLFYNFSIFFFIVSVSFSVFTNSSFVFLSLPILHWQVEFIYISLTQFVTEIKFLSNGKQSLTHRMSSESVRKWERESPESEVSESEREYLSRQIPHNFNILQTVLTLTVCLGARTKYTK